MGRGKFREMRLRGHLLGDFSFLSGRKIVSLSSADILTVVSSVPDCVAESCRQVRPGSSTKFLAGLYFPLQYWAFGVARMFACCTT